MSSRERAIDNRNAEVAELADAQASGACVAYRVGSSPSSAIIFYSKKELIQFPFFCSYDTKDIR